MVMAGADITSRGIEESCYNALIAGNDIIMISRTASTYQRIWDYLYNKIQTESNFKEIIKVSVGRILSTKLSYLKRENSVSLYPDIEKIYLDPESRYSVSSSLKEAHTSRAEALVLCLRVAEKSVGKDRICVQGKSSQ